MKSFFQILAIFSVVLVTGCLQRSTTLYKSFPELEYDPNAVLEEGELDEAERQKQIEALKELEKKHTLTYTINAGDVISIVVYDHGELNIQTKVTPDGYIGMVFVGQIKVEGMTLKEAGEALEKADPSNKEVYAANTAAYQEKLGELDRQYQEAADTAKVRTLLFGDRFPFLYLAEDYGLSYYAAFSGCSAETEASFETVAFLAARADEIPVSCVLTIDGSDKRIAETIVRSTKNQDQKILTLNSMQSISGKQAGEGVTYLSVMEENLPVLREALGS